MMNPAVKRSIHGFVPIILAAVATYVAFRKKADWKIMLVVAGVSWLLSYILARQATRLITNITDQPPQIDVPVGVGGSVPSGFDAEGWAKLLRDDVYTIFATRNTELYQQVAAMNESQLAAIGNAWNRLFFSEHQESLPQAIEAEWFGFLPFPYPDQIIGRLRKLGFV